MWLLFYYRIDFENAINQMFFWEKKFYSLEIYIKTGSNPLLLLFRNFTCSRYIRIKHPFGCFYNYFFNFF